VTTRGVVNCFQKAHVQGLNVKSDPIRRPAAAAAAFPGRLNVSGLDSWCRLGAFRARRTDPNFDEVGVAIAAIHNGDASRIDSALIRQIVRRAPREHIGPARAAGSSGIDDDVSLRVRSVLQLDGQVVKARPREDT
jgi:hypothetical protein